MRYPKPIKLGSTFGITAPSSGVEKNLHNRLDLAIQNLISKGFKIKEGNCLRSSHKHVSASKEQRASEFMEFYLDESIDAIYPPWGGEFLIEILPLLDFIKLKNAPAKWVIGYSDISTLLIALTLKLDTATVHGTNLIDTIPLQKDPLSKGLLEILQKNPCSEFTQFSSEKWQSNWTDFEKKPEQPFNLTENVLWKSLKKEKLVTFKGRLFGGCLDTIACLTGTSYGDVNPFFETYKKDGLIFYLDNCELAPTDFVRYIYNIRLAGWLKGVTGILIGRTSSKKITDKNSTNHEEALELSFGDLEIPIIYNTDIGHCPPQLTLINGAVAEVKYENSGGQITQWLR